MLNFIKIRIKKINLTLLIISVFLSFALWIVCLNFIDPITHKTFTLQLQIRNEEALSENLRVIGNRREINGLSINVNVTGLSSDLDLLSANNTIIAYVDMRSSELIYASKLNSEIPTNIIIEFKAPAFYENYTITSTRPNKVNVVIDSIEEKEMDITVIRRGDLPQGYIAMDNELSVDKVVMKGPSALISKINRLLIEVNIDDARTHVVEEGLVIRPIDFFGNIVTGAEFSDEIVDIRVPIFRLGTVSVKEPETVGEFDNDWSITSISYEPQTFEIIGHVDDIEKVSEIILDPLDISGIQGPYDYRYDISEYLERINEELGIKVQLRNPNRNQVVVKIDAEPIIAREFYVNVDRDIHFSGEASLGNRKRTLLTEWLTVIVRGPQSVLQDIEALTGIVDPAHLSTVEDGDYSVKVNFLAPAEGTAIVSGPHFIWINLSSYSTPAPTTTPETADTNTSEEDSEEESEDD